MDDANGQRWKLRLTPIVSTRRDAHADEQTSNGQWGGLRSSSAATVDGPRDGSAVAVGRIRGYGYRHATWWQRTDDRRRQPAQSQHHRRGTRTHRRDFHGLRENVPDDGQHAAGRAESTRVRNDRDMELLR